MEKNLYLTDEETGKKYSLTPTKIGQIIAKIKLAKQFITDGDNDSAIQFLTTVLRFSDQILFEMVPDPDSTSWSTEILKPVDYDSFYDEDESEDF